MDDPGEPHRYGELIEIRWPGGAHDYTIRFERADHIHAPGWEGWLVVRGFVVKPKGPGHQTTRSFYCHPIGDREYEMIPHKPA